MSVRSPGNGEEQSGLSKFIIRFLYADLYMQWYGFYLSMKVQSLYSENKVVCASICSKKGDCHEKDHVGSCCFDAGGIPGNSVCWRQ
jgi:hypothetical protein